MSLHANTNWGPDDNDVFHDSRMSFPDHIEDLRAHLLRALKGFVVALIFSFLIGSYVVEFITAPVKEQLKAFEQKRIAAFRKKLVQEPALQQLNEAAVVNRDVNLRALAKELGLPAPKQEWWSLPTRVHPLEEALNVQEAFLVIKEPTLMVFTVTEGIMVFMKVCLATALVLGSAWIFYQIWSFIAAGLYRHERRWVHLFLPASLGLFLAGVGLCQFIVLPQAIEYLLGFNEWLGFQPELRLSEWLGFAIFLPLVFGISFQTPLVMIFLERVGLVPVEVFRSKRRIAWFLLAVLAAVLTPTPDPINMMFLWVPLGLLYESGIAVCSFLPRHSSPDAEPSEHEELIEV